MNLETSPACKDSASVQESTIDLSVIRGNGRDVVSTHGIPEIDDVKMTAVEFHSNDIHHRVTTTSADDIFSLPPEERAEAMPPHGQFARAVFAFLLHGATRPHGVELIPPHTIKLQFPADAPLVAQWVAKSHLLIQNPIARAIALLLCAFLDLDFSTLDLDDLFYEPDCAKTCA